jgi:trans-aconitate methyltransferase
LTTAALGGRSGQIIELGCGSGDISGFFSDSYDVLGVDVVLAARDACAKRWPNMEFRLRSIESIPPRECDVLILTEILEHLAEPLKIVETWLPLAKTAVIGHPLCPPDKEVERGHCWSYDYNDWTNWFKVGGHERVWTCMFPMTAYEEMVLGWSRRVCATA